MRSNHCWKRILIICFAFCLLAAALLPLQAGAAEAQAPTLHVLIEYAAQEKTTGVTVTYAGARFDPNQTENELSLRVLKGVARELRYQYDPAQEEANRVTLTISNA